MIRSWLRAIGLLRPVVVPPPGSTPRSIEVDQPPDDAWLAPKGSLNPEDLGEQPILKSRAKKARFEALELALVRQAEAGRHRPADRLPKRPALPAHHAAARHPRGLPDRRARPRSRQGGRLTGEALAAGAVSVRQAEKIAEAIKALPEYVGADERHQAEELLIEAATWASPEELSRLGTSLLERIAPEEAERLLGEELEKKERKAEQKRSLRYLPNGIPQSESVRITLPVWEMELLRKIIEPLAQPRNGADPDTRTIEQRRGDGLAEALGLLGAATTAPVRVAGDRRSR